MAGYVDGFVLVVPNDKSEGYKQMASFGRDAWMKHGALQYFECRGEDMKQQEMGEEKTRSFPEMAGAKEGETVWFSFILFRDRAHRDEVNAKVMAEMSSLDPNSMPVQIDMSRMAYGGFAVEVEG